MASHTKDNVMVGWVRVEVEEELAKLNVHGDHELGPFFLLRVLSGRKLDVSLKIRWRH